MAYLFTKKGKCPYRENDRGTNKILNYSTFNGDPSASPRPTGSTASAHVILSGAIAESNCKAAPSVAKVESRADFAQDDTLRHE